MYTHTHVDKKATVKKCPCILVKMYVNPLCVCMHVCKKWMRVQAVANSSKKMSCHV